MIGRAKISVAMATWNEEKAISKVVSDIKKYAGPDLHEIIIVDSSTDRTAQVAESMGVKVIKQEQQGHGLALRTAMAAATGDVVITADCDDTYPMEMIPDLAWMVINDGYDVVSCSRLTKELKDQMPVMNRLANRIFAAIVRLLYGIPTHDVTTGMFAIKREVISRIAFETNYSLPAEIIIRSNLAGLRYREVPISYRTRIGTVTLNKWRSGKAYLKCFLKYKYFRNIDPKGL